MASANQPEAVDVFERLRRHQPPERATMSAKIRSLEQTYILNPRDKRIENEVDNLIDGALRHKDALLEGPHRNVGKLAEGQVLAVLGASGAGKTRLLERQFTHRPEFYGYGQRDVPCPLVTVKARGPFTLAEFARSLAAAAGVATDRAFRNRDAAFRFAHHQLRDQILFVHIDEAQVILESGNEAELQAGRNALRSLCYDSDWPVSLILSGLPHTARLFSDFQIGRRQQTVMLQQLDLTSDAAFLKLALETFLEKAELRLALKKGELLPRLAHAALNQFGDAIDMMQRAVKVALLEDGNEELTMGHFQQAFFQRVGCPDIYNVFAEDVEFDQIDVAALYSRKHELDLGQAPLLPSSEPFSKKPKHRRRSK